MRRFIFALLLIFCVSAIAGQPLRTNTATEIMVTLLDSSGDPVTSLTSIGGIEIWLYTIAYDASTITEQSEITPTASGGNNDMVHKHNGLWTLELTAGNTNYVGRLNISIYDADNDEFILYDNSHEVLAANVFDAKFGGDYLDVNVASEDNIDFGALKKTSLNAATTDLSAITGDKSSYKATGYAEASDITTAHSTTDALVNGIDDNPWDSGTRTLTAIDLSAITGDKNSYKADVSGLSTHDAAAVKTAIEAGGSTLAQVLADTSAYDTDGEYATAIWNALTNAYGGVGTYGQAIEDGAGGLTAQQVWEYNISGISTGGYAGTIANAILADTGAYDTDAEYATAIWGATMENSKSYAAVMRVFAAVLSGKSSAAADQMSFIGIDGTTTRLTVTVSSGARTSVDTWDGTP